MNWQSYFDQTYVITLLKPERFLRLKGDFNQYGINLRWFKGIEDENGQKGIYLSLMSLFRECVEKNYSRVLVFEDDCQFKVPPAEFNSYMDSIVTQALELDWLQIKLGSVLIRPVETLVRPNLFKIEGSYGLHACAYSREFMELALALPESLPIDVCWMKEIEPLGRSYHSYPLLASQYPGYSNIERRVIDWTPHIEGAFKAHTKNLLEKYKIHLP
jgi:hypothetical protein